MSNDLYPELQDLLSATLVEADRRASFDPQIDLLPRDKKAFEADIKKDKRFTLPAGLIRPYQLWFGFLKAALTDPNLHVDRKFYEPWGAVETMTFAQWWPDHWRELFAVDRSMRFAQHREDVDIQEGVLWLRLPLGEDYGSLTTRFGRLVRPHHDARRSVYEQGRFGFDCGTNEAGRQISPATRFLKDVDNVDVLLWLYSASVIGKLAGVGGRGEGEAAFLLSLKQYASGRGRFIKAPKAITSFVNEMVSRGERERGQRDPKLPEHRRQLARYLKKARRIAQNVAQGRFPGQY